MCGTEQSREAGDYHADAFNQQAVEGGNADWNHPTRFDYQQGGELETEPTLPDEMKDRDPDANFFKNLEEDDRKTVASVRGKRQKLGLWKDGSDGTMIVGADPYLKNNDILAKIKNLLSFKKNASKVRFEDWQKKSSTSSSGLLILGHATNSEIFAPGVDSKYNKLAGGGLFKDKEFPPNLDSLVGYGVNPRNGRTLKGAEKYV